MKKIWSYLIILLALSWSLAGCSDRITPPELSTVEPSSTSITPGKLSEVAPPSLIQQLQQALEQYQPQVSIVSPKANQVLQDNTVELQVKVQDLPIFKDPNLEMGTYLNFILDNELPQAIYDLDKPVILENLAPGTHTIRIFASKPWHESFKNEGAYAQTTFHIFTKTENNQPDSNLALLTYSRPNGNYGAEPIMLDFYLTNAPLHLIAQENPEDEIVDWRIRVTINGESFLLDDWQPLYLKGFEEGRNWVQLEFIDEKGNPISNIYNNTVRLISYTPNGQDSLSKLVRGELTLEQARRIIDPNYKVESIPIPAPNLEPTPTEEIPLSPPEIVPENTLPKEEKTSPILPPTSAEEIPTLEEETSPEISPYSEDQKLPEDFSSTPETPVTIEETKPPQNLPTSIEESVTLEQEVSSEKSTQEGSSSARESAVTNEQELEENPSQPVNIIPKTKEQTSVISPSEAQEQSLQTVSETTAEELKSVNFNDSFEQKTTPLEQPTKYSWLEKIRSRLRRD